MQLNWTDRIKPTQLQQVARFIGMDAPLRPSVFDNATAVAKANQHVDKSLKNRSLLVAESGSPEIA